MQRIPFDPAKEMQYTATYKDFVGPNRTGIENFKDVAKLNTPISIKENYMSMVKDRSQLWMPCFSDPYSFNPSEFPDNVARAFVSQVNPFDKENCSGGADWFGVDWVYMSSAGGSMVTPGNPKVRDLEHWEDYITFPDLTKLNWEEMSETNKPLFESNERPVCFTQFTGLFERLISFVDFEDAALAMIDEDEQEHVHRLFDKLTNFYIELMTLCKKYFPIDIYLFHDDWGSQRAPFFSLDTCREMLVPYMKRLVNAAHSLGIVFSSHSCGKNEMLLPAYIECGIDIWCPQPMNDVAMLLAQSENKIVLGANVTNINNSMSDAEIVKAADEYFDVYKVFRNVLLNVRGDAAAVKKFKDHIYALSRECYNN